MACPGHSVIYDPDGREIARSSEGKKQFLIANLPPERLFNEKGRRVYGSLKLADQAMPTQIPC